MKALAAIVLELFSWALFAAACVFVLYCLVRFVKWAWTDRQVPPSQDHRPFTKEEWGDLLDTATDHTSDGRFLCMKCGEPIPLGEGVILTDDEKKGVAQQVRPDFAAFFHLTKHPDCSTHQA